MENLGYGFNFNIALNMSLEQLRFYCTSNELFKRICSNQEFWLQRLQREYPDIIKYKPIDMTWSQYSTGLESGNIKVVYVVYNGEMIGKILMFSTDRMTDVYSRAINLLSIEPNIDPTSIYISASTFATNSDSNYLDLDEAELTTTVKRALKDPLYQQSVQRIWCDNSFFNDLEIMSIFNEDLFRLHPRYWPIFYRK
jgi:hypothetical protein